MAFTDTTPDSGHWCSRSDCVDVLDEIERIIGADEQKLNRQIRSATGLAQSQLRGRWPLGFPFYVDPPPELRHAVACIAVHRAVRGRTFSGGALQISDRLASEAREAEAWIAAVGDSRAHLACPSQDASHAAHLAAVPTGEFGFVE